MNWLILSIIIIISISTAICCYLSLYILIFSLIIDDWDEWSNGKS